MTKFLQTFLISLLATILLATSTLAQSDDLSGLIAELPNGNYADREEVVNKIAATGDPLAERVLVLLEAGELIQLDADGSIVRGERDGRNYNIFDLFSDEPLESVSTRAVEKIAVNNGLRRAIRAAIGSMTLMSTDATARLSAAQSIFNSGDPEQLGALDIAIENESDPEILLLMQQARAGLILTASDNADAKSQAVAVLAERGDQEALGKLTAAKGSADEALNVEIDAAIAGIEATLAAWQVGQNIWYGLSLGSVLLLAAIGLAITFGVMGVINMAHGEIVMLGAYTTFVVQETIRTSAPWLFDYSLTIAVPAAFLVAGAVGVGIERGVIRFLYGRPLETLLATWGISLILQQAVRTIFGPNNREVGNPTWMSGSFELGGLDITWGRMWIFVFAIVVFLLLLAVLAKTSMGLRMRAVTQNRRMASAIGIRTPWIDALTFGLGSGIAGIAGVALSQIDNVSPNLGQSYIIDSFMVVVFGGVGNLWGTLVGALSLGVINKFLEPYAGAVLGKILVLVFLILFIQRRPRGLFALKGRAVDQ